MAFDDEPNAADTDASTADAIAAIGVDVAAIASADAFASACTGSAYGHERGWPAWSHTSRKLGAGADVAANRLVRAGP